MQRGPTTSGTSALREGRYAIPDDVDRSDGIDLDALAAGYRHRPLSTAAQGRARTAAETLSEGRVALDIGGGTGMHAAQWSETGATAIVVDPSRAMLAEARKRGVRVVCGRAQALPFRDASCAVTYFHLSLHYGDWRASLDEAWRVLQPGGRLWVWTLGMDHHRQALIHRYFPQLLAIDLDRFPEPGLVVDHLAGFGADVATTKPAEDKQMAAGQWETAVRARFISTLQHLSADELEHGLERFHAEHPDSDEPVHYQLLWTGLVAVR